LGQNVFSIVHIERGAGDGPRHATAHKPKVIAPETAVNIDRATLTPKHRDQSSSVTALRVIRKFNAEKNSKMMVKY